MENKDKRKKLLEEIWRDPSKRERLIFVVFVVLGVCLLFLSILQIYSNIRAPFIRQALESQLNKANRIISQGQSNTNTQATVEELKAKDTDKDGLSDYDELYIYNTSPYLEDTDSDGIWDKKEIEDRTDPNCPKGKTCQVISTNTNNAATTEPTNNSLDLSQINSLLEQNQQQETLNNILSGEIDAQQLRQLLLEAGMSKEVLDKFDDETLKQVYIETIKNINSQQ